MNLTKFGRESNGDCKCPIIVGETGHNSNLFGILSCISRGSEVIGMNVMRISESLRSDVTTTSVENCHFSLESKYQCTGVFPSYTIYYKYTVVIF